MIRSQENQDDKKISEERLELDREKMVKRDEMDEEKIRSQEDIAALRAKVSREKMNQPKGKKCQQEIKQKALFSVQTTDHIQFPIFLR